MIRTVATGNGSLGVVFDGANIWVVNRGSSTATKIRASDGTTLGNFSAPNYPYGIVFDGTYMWLAGDFANVVLRAADGGVVADWRNDTTTGIAFDGAHMWIANLNQNTVTKY